MIILLVLDDSIVWDLWIAAKWLDHQHFRTFAMELSLGNVGAEKRIQH